MRSVALFFQDGASTIISCFLPGRAPFWTYFSAYSLFITQTKKTYSIQKWSRKETHHSTIQHIGQHFLKMHIRNLWISKSFSFIFNLSYKSYNASLFFLRREYFIKATIRVFSYKLAVPIYPITNNITWKRHFYPPTYLYPLALPIVTKRYPALETRHFYPPIFIYMLD